MIVFYHDKVNWHVEIFVFLPSRGVIFDGILYFDSIFFLLNKILTGIEGQVYGMPSLNPQVKRLV